MVVSSAIAARNSVANWKKLSKIFFDKKLAILFVTTKKSFLTCNIFKKSSPISKNLFHFTKGLKMKWLTSLPIYLIKKQLYRKLLSKPLIHFDVLAIYICTTRFKNLRYNSVWKLLTVFPVKDFPVFLITKCYMWAVYVGRERMPGFTSARNSLDL